MLRGSLYEKNGIWQVSTRVPNGSGGTKQISRTTKIEAKPGNKKKAQEKMREILLNLEKEFAEPDKSDNQILFLDWIEMWMELKCALRPGTIEGYRSYIDNHIVPHFQPLSLSVQEITPQHLQDFYNKKYKENYTANTLKHFNVIINGALEEAVIKGLIPENPVRRVTFPRRKKFEGKAYTEDQLEQLLTLAKDTPIERCIILAAMYGLRRSEVCGLRWQDIDFENNTMTICNTRVKFQTEIEAEQTKSEASRRTIKLIPSTVSYLKKLKFEQRREAVLHGWEVSESKHVCTRPDGTPYSINYVTQGFNYFLKKNGLPVIRFHDLRHTACSLLLENGATPTQVQAFLGHEKVDTTLNVYSHLSKEGAEQTALIMDRIIKRKEA